MTLQEKGYVDVGTPKGTKPVNIYYERYGDGPEKVLLVMGNYNSKENK